MNYECVLDCLVFGLQLKPRMVKISVQNDAGDIELLDHPRIVPVELAEELWNAGIDAFKAAMLGRIDRVEALLNGGADVNAARDGEGADRVDVASGHAAARDGRGHLAAAAGEHARDADD